MKMYYIECILLLESIFKKTRKVIFFDSSVSYFLFSLSAKDEVHVGETIQSFSAPELSNIAISIPKSNQISCFSNENVLMLFFYIALLFAAFCTVCVAYDPPCQMGRQPDPNSDFKMRWVLPYTKEERCACTKVVYGGMNIDPPPGAEDHFYTDHPLLFINNHDEKNLTELLGCLNKNGGK